MPDNRYPLGSRLGVGASVVAVVGFALAARANSWFFSDDYLAFSHALTRSFTEFLETPIDVHFLPLHRLATWLIYTLFPLNFDVALFVMCAFHLAGVWMLYRTLDVIGESALNGPLTALYGTNFYVAVVLTWWTVGIARLPYVFFSLAAIYQYLKFRQGGSIARIVLLLTCMVSATAFYTKAILIPGFLGALELALLPGTPFRKAVRNAGVIVVAALAAYAYYKLGISYGVDELKTQPFDWVKQVAAFDIILKKTPQSLLGLLPSWPLSIQNWVVISLWAVFFGASVWRDRFNIVVWGAGLSVVIVNFLVITISQRMVFGPLIVANDRYYFENLYLLVLFVAIIAKRMRIAECLKNSNHARVFVAGAWLATGLLAIGSQARFLEVLNTPRYAQLRLAKDFGWNLTEAITDLRRAHGGTLGFANGYPPVEILGIAAMEIRDYSEILPIFDSNVAVINGAPCLYSVKNDGTIQQPGESCP